MDDFVRTVAGNEVPLDVRPLSAEKGLPGGLEGVILGILRDEPLEAAALAQEADADVTQTLVALSTLAVAGWVEQLPGMRFRRAG